MPLGFTAIIHKKVVKYSSNRDTNMYSTFD